MSEVEALACWPPSPCMIILVFVIAATMVVLWSSCLKAGALSDPRSPPFRCPLPSVPARPVFFAADLHRGGVSSGHGRRELYSGGHVAHARDGDPRERLGASDRNLYRDPVGNGGGSVDLEVWDKILFFLPSFSVPFLVLCCCRTNKSHTQCRSDRLGQSWIIFELDRS